MKITALRPQKGEYGYVDAGQTVDVRKALAEKLLNTKNWATPAQAKKLLEKKPETAANKASGK